MSTTTMPAPRRVTSGVARLVRRLERERRHWTRPGRDEVATETAWRAGVAEGLRLAQTAIRKGV
jgi:predicted transcriptional regulator